MSYRVVWTNRARKQLLKIEKPQRVLIASWVKENLDGCENPKGIENSKKIEGTRNGWRYRVGSYRVLATIKEGELVVEVVRVGHRRGVYANLPKM